MCHFEQKWYNFCREVCATIIEEESTQVGGVGEVVEIDESKFGKRKYHKGRGCGFLVGLIDGRHSVF